MTKYKISAHVATEDWLEAQALEADWWMELDFHTVYRVYAFTHLMMNYLDISLEQPGRVILDVGCGPVPRIGLFRQATLIGLDPLLEKYEQIPYQTLDRLDQQFGIPVEELAPELADKIDFLVSVNVLDHGYNAEAFLENCACYLKSDGLFLLSFDLHPKLDNLHPLCLDRASAIKMCQKYFEVEYFVLGLPWKNKISYHGDKASRAITLLLASKNRTSWRQQTQVNKREPVSKSEELSHLLEANLYALRDAPPAYPSIHRVLRVVDAGLGFLEYYPLRLYRRLKQR